MNILFLYHKAIIVALIIDILATIYLTMIIYHIFKEKEFGWEKIFTDLLFVVIIMIIPITFCSYFVIVHKLYISFSSVSEDVSHFFCLAVLLIAGIPINAVKKYKEW